MIANYYFTENTKEVKINEKVRIFSEWFSSSRSINSITQCIEC